MDASDLFDVLGRQEAGLVNDSCATTPEPQGVVVGVAGFTHGPSGELSGSGAEDSDVADIVNSIVDRHPGLEPVITDWTSPGDVVSAVVAERLESPDAPVFIAAHSAGADAAIEAVQTLDSMSQQVDGLYVMEGWGSNVEALPQNVESSINFWSSSRDGVNGQENIDGAWNLAVPDTSHTEIENVPYVRDVIDTDIDTKMAITSIGTMADTPPSPFSSPTDPWAGGSVWDTGSAWDTGSSSIGAGSSSPGVTCSTTDNFGTDNFGTDSGSTSTE